MGLVRAILWLLLVAATAFAVLVLVRHGVSDPASMLDAARAESEAVARWLRATLAAGSGAP